MKSDSRTDVSALWARYKDNGDPAARDELILNFSPLVKYVAGRLASSLPQTVDTADLISYGIFGLIDAIEKYDLEPRDQVRDIRDRADQGRDHRRASRDGLGPEVRSIACPRDRERLRRARERVQAGSFRPGGRRSHRRIAQGLPRHPHQAELHLGGQLRGALGRGRPRRRSKRDRHHPRRHRR